MAAPRRSSGVLRLALALATLMAALSFVVWRQSRALEAVRALEKVRDERAAAEAARTEVQDRIQRLESRSRVVADAERRLGMHVPMGEEIVILPAAARGAGGGR
jgi:cell division protein FtsL